MLGHMSASVLVALGAPWAMRVPPRSGTWPSAWDAMVREYVRGRWVMVELKNGPASQVFIADTTQFLFLPADAVASVAALTDIERDRRITKPGTPLAVVGGTNG